MVFDMYKFSAEKDAKELKKINLSKLREKEESLPEEEPKDFYRRINEKSEEGPIFSKNTLNFIYKIHESRLPKKRKVFIKWLANELENNKSLKVSDDDLIQIKDFLNSTDIDFEHLSFEELLRAAKNWHTEEFEVIEDAGPYSTKNVIYDFGNGYTIVDVPPEDLETEGKHMGHCVGGDDYKEDLLDNKGKIYSLRDSNNKPHVTIHYNSLTGTIIQIKGKENKPPIPKYFDMIDKWLKESQIDDEYHLSTDYITGIHNEDKIKELSESGDHFFITQGLAFNENTPSNILEKIINEKRDDYEYAFMNPNISHDVLRKHINNYRHLEFIIENKNLPEEIIEELVTSKDENIRTYAVHIHNIPEKYLNILANDKSYYVINEIYKLDKIPQSTSEILIKNPIAIDTGVFYDLAKRNSTSSEIIKHIYDNTNSFETIKLVSINPNTPPEILSEIYDDSDLRVWLAYNPNLPEFLKTKLLQDPDEEVVKAIKSMEKDASNLFSFIMKIARNFEYYSRFN